MSEEGTIEMQIDRFSEFVRDEDLKTQRRLSDPTYIYGLPWKIEAYPSAGSAVNQKSLGFFLQCNGGDDDPNWSCKANFELQIVSQKAGVDDAVGQTDHKFSQKGKRWGYPVFIGCDKLLDPEKGFIKDDIVILRAGVEAEMPQNALMSQLRAFASSISDSADGTLIVGTNKIPIHKAYLSHYSEYFKAMFASEFKEGREDEIVIEEVEYVDMFQLLSVIYPFNAQITDKNLKVILKLADRFIMPMVLKQCKKQLKTSNLNVAQKLLLAQQYNFKDLLKKFAKQCKTVADAKKVKSEPEYELLDRDTLSLIIDSITS